MKIPEFKPSKRYLRDISLSCLAASVKNSELPTVAARYIPEFKSDPNCEIYLRGKEPKKISVWQQEMVELLFEKEGLADAVVKGMKDCNAATSGFDDLDEVELRQIKERGIEAFIMVSMIAIDEITKEVMVKANTIFDCVLDEHGMVFVLRNGQWSFEEGDYLIRVVGAFFGEQELKKQQKLEQLWESVFPPPEPDTLADNDGRNLFGVWRYNPEETARVRKLLGASPRDIKDALSSGLSSGAYFAPSKTESLSNGQCVVSRDVERYEHKGTWHTVHFGTNTPPHLAVPERYWCDGKWLIRRSGNNVFARAEDSYRKSEPVPEDPLQALIKQTAIALLKKKSERKQG